jgi:Flp pilus assembly pilin Flp
MYWGTLWHHMSKVLKSLKDEAGIGAVDYVLIAVGVSVVLIATGNSLGANLTAMER